MRRIEYSRFKGLPLSPGVPVIRIGDLGRNAVRDLWYPALVIHEAQVVHNITTMADYCGRHRVELAPHAKTSLYAAAIRRQGGLGIDSIEDRLRDPACLVHQEQWAERMSPLKAD